MQNQPAQHRHLLRRQASQKNPPAQNATDSSPNHNQPAHRAVLPMRRLQLGLQHLLQRLQPHNPHMIP